MGTAVPQAQCEPLLMTALEAAVPLLIMRLRTEPFEVRQRIGAEAGHVLAAQADTMMYGSGRVRYGDGATDLRKHNGHVRPVTREVHDGCGTCRNGHPDYSAGEVFNFLARALAVGACQPGGVTFCGLHWCARRHPSCGNARGKPAPVCCTCGGGCPLAAGGAGECPAGSCPWCRNGCTEDCHHPALVPPFQDEPPSPPDIPAGFRPDEEYGPPREAG